MAHLGTPGGIRVGGHPSLGAVVFEEVPAIPRLSEVPQKEQHHVYLLDLGNVEKQLQILTSEVRGLREDLASRTLSAQFRRLWSTIRAWWATVRGR